jgi:hypothetical protein
MLIRGVPFCIFKTEAGWDFHLETDGSYFWSARTLREGLEAVDRAVWRTLAKGVRE